MRLLAGRNGSAFLLGGHALLNDGPQAAGGEDEGMMVNLVAVLKGGVVHFRRHPAGIDQVGREGNGECVAPSLYLLRCLPRCRSFPSGNEDAEFPLPPLQALLQSPASCGGDAGGMPVEAKRAAKHLEPEGVRQLRQHLLRPELLHHNPRHPPPASRTIRSKSQRGAFPPWSGRLAMPVRMV
jgi:hypothetical protein